MNTAVPQPSSAKARSDSSTSATNGPAPTRALLPNSGTIPPTNADGSSPAPCIATAIMLVVVVLPCVPITPTLGPARSRSPSSAMRGRTSVPEACAATSSG